MVGMFALCACLNGRMNRSGNSVASAMPFLDVCSAAWNSCTCCEPLAVGGALLVSVTPVARAAAAAPSDISWAKFSDVVS